MAAELQPAVELAVVREKIAASVGGNNPCGARDMAGAAGAIETIGVRLNQRTVPIDDGRFVGEDAAIAGQHVE
jgi:hypothetical protein